MKTRELKLVKLHGGRTLLGSIKKARNFKKPKGNNEQAQKCDRRGYNAHKPKKSVQQRMNRVISAGKLDTLPK